MARKKQHRPVDDEIADQQAIELPNREALSLVFGAIPAPAAAVGAAESAEEVVDEVAEAAEEAAKE